MKFPYLYDGTIFTSEGTGLKNPAILITKDDMFSKYGEQESIQKEFDRRIASYAAMGFMDDVENIVMVSFDTFLGLPVEMVAYIIRRSMEYTATGFVAKLAYLISNPNHYKDANEQTSYIKTWLDAEMERLPIDVTVNEPY